MVLACGGMSVPPGPPSYEMHQVRILSSGLVREKVGNLIYSLYARHIVNAQSMSTIMISIVIANRGSQPLSNCLQNSTSDTKFF